MWSNESQWATYMKMNIIKKVLYLNSHSLLVEHNRVKFNFHQTFYEYCFARQFVEKQRVS